MSTISLEPWLELLDTALPPEQNGVLVRFTDALAGPGPGPLRSTLDPNRPEAVSGVDLGILPLDGLHPAELLEGFTAPDDWLALGIVTRGWAAPMGATRPSAHPGRRRVRTTVLVDRAGAVVGRTVDDLGAVVIDGPPGEGAVLDLLRSAMGVG